MIARIPICHEVITLSQNLTVPRAVVYVALIGLSSAAIHNKGVFDFRAQTTP